MKSGFIVNAIILMSGVSVGFAAYVENWDNNSAGANGWYYFDKQGYEPLCGYVYDSGQGGHITSNLSLLGDWSGNNSFDMYPAYTAVYDVNKQNNLINQLVSISMRDLSPAGTGVDLKGGSILFWVGEYNATSNLSVYYSLKKPLIAPVPDHIDPEAGLITWQNQQFIVSGDESDWEVISFTPTQGLNKTVSEILAGPQQYGFRIFGGSAEPEGVMGFDNLVIVPEPATVFILAFGGWYLRRRHF